MATLNVKGTEHAEAHRLKGSCKDVVPCENIRGPKPSCGEQYGFWPCPSVGHQSLTKVEVLDA